MHVMSTNIEDLKPYFKCLKDLGYCDINYDALWKWASILMWADKYFPETRGLKILEAGGGHSPLGWILGQNNEYINVDRDFTDRWFPKGIGILNVFEHQITASRDFIRYCEELPNKSIDIVIDSCSIIHFNTSSQNINKGLHDSCKQINRILKPAGIFITSSDTLIPENLTESRNTGELLFPLSFQECIESSGLRLISDSNDLDTCPFIISELNNTPQHKKLVTGKPISGWKQGSETLTISSGVFKSTIST